MSFGHLPLNDRDARTLLDALREYASAIRRHSTAMCDPLISEERYRELDAAENAARCAIVRLVFSGPPVEAPASLQEPEKVA